MHEYTVFTHTTRGFSAALRFAAGVVGLLKPYGFPDHTEGAAARKGMTGMIPTPWSDMVGHFPVTFSPFTNGNDMLNVIGVMNGRIVYGHTEGVACVEISLPSKSGVMVSKLVMCVSDHPFHRAKSAHNALYELLTSMIEQRMLDFDE